MRFLLSLLSSLILLATWAALAAADASAHPPVQVLADGSQLIRLSHPAHGEQAITIKGKGKIGKKIASGRYDGYVVNGKKFKPATVLSSLAPNAPLAPKKVQFHHYLNTPLIVTDPANPNAKPAIVQQPPPINPPQVVAPPKPTHFSPTYVDSLTAAPYKRAAGLRARLPKGAKIVGGPVYRDQYEAELKAQAVVKQQQLQQQAAAQKAIWEAYQRENAPVTATAQAVENLTTASPVATNGPRFTQVNAPVSYVDDISNPLAVAAAHAAAANPVPVPAPAAAAAAHAAIPQPRSLISVFSSADAAQAAQRAEASAAKAAAAAEAALAAASAAKAKADLTNAQKALEEVKRLNSEAQKHHDEMVKIQQQSAELEKVNRQRELHLNDMETKIRTHAIAIQSLIQSSQHTVLHDQKQTNTAELMKSVKHLQDLIKALEKKSRADDEKISLLQKQVNKAELRKKPPTWDEIKQVVDKKIAENDPASSLLQIQATESHVEQLLNTIDRKARALGRLNVASVRLQQFAELFRTAATKMKDMTATVNSVSQVAAQEGLEEQQAFAELHTPNPVVKKVEENNQVEAEETHNEAQAQAQNDGYEYSWEYY